MREVAATDVAEEDAGSSNLLCANLTEAILLRQTLNKLFPLRVSQLRVTAEEILIVGLVSICICNNMITDLTLQQKSCEGKGEEAS